MTAKATKEKTKVSEVSQIRTILMEKQNTISPGQPFRLTSAHTVGDGVWQGDLGLEIIKSVPKGYIEIKNLQPKDRQLVPEAGAGSHHRLRSLDGVRIFLPPDFAKDDMDLRGPVIVLSKPNAIDHEPGHDKPHGTVMIEDSMTIGCRYQRNLVKEGIARRVKD